MTKIVFNVLKSCQVQASCSRVHGRHYDVHRELSFYLNLVYCTVILFSPGCKKSSLFTMVVILTWQMWKNTYILLFWFKSMIFSKKSSDLNRDLNQWFKSPWFKSGNPVCKVIYTHLTDETVGDNREDAFCVRFAQSCINVHTCVASTVPSDGNYNPNCWSKHNSAQAILAHLITDKLAHFKIADTRKKKNRIIYDTRV